MNLKELKSLIIAVGEGLKTTDVEVVEATLINTIREAMQISVEPVEKVVEKEIIKEVPVIKEVVPTAVQEELASLQDKNEELNNQIQDLEDKVDDLNSQIKDLECDLNDSMNIAETALNDVETLQARCTELHDQNEFLLSQLEQPEEEVAFEEPEEVSNEDILANSMNEEVDEETILNQLEKSLELVAIEEVEKK